jgi:hypothetical protein
MNGDHGHEHGNSECPTRCIDGQAYTCTLVEVRDDTGPGCAWRFSPIRLVGTHRARLVVGGKPWHGGIASLAEPIKADACSFSVCLLATFNCCELVEEAGSLDADTLSIEPVTHMQGSLRNFIARYVPLFDLTNQQFRMQPYERDRLFEPGCCNTSYLL